MTHSPNFRINVSIFMRIAISRILHTSFVIIWGNSRSHNLCANTKYQLIYTEETLHNNWDLCSNALWVPFYPYTTFQNPMSKPSCQNSRKTIITQKVLVTQISNIVHCKWHTQKPECADFQAFSNTFSSLKLTFCNFLLGASSKQPKTSHFVDFDWENASKCLERHEFGV